MPRSSRELCIKYSGWKVPNNVTDWLIAYLNALARLGIRLPVSRYRRRHWLNRSHSGKRQISGMAIFLYQNWPVHAWMWLLFSCSTSESKKSPDAIKQMVHNISWNTFTMLEIEEWYVQRWGFLITYNNTRVAKYTHLVNTSPTYVKKNVGDTNGASRTCLIATHSGFLNFQGKIKHLQV